MIPDPFALDPMRWVFRRTAKSEPAEDVSELMLYHWADCADHPAIRALAVGQTFADRAGGSWTRTI